MGVIQGVQQGVIFSKDNGCVNRLTLKLTVENYFKWPTIACSCLNLNLKKCDFSYTYSLVAPVSLQQICRKTVHQTANTALTAFI